MEDVVQYNAVMDSLMYPTSKGFDYNQLFDKLKDVNFLTFEEHLDILSIGYRWNDDWRFTINLASKTELRFNFTEDLVRLIAEVVMEAPFLVQQLI